MADDHIRFEASFNEFDAYVRQAKDILQTQLEKAVALGDDALASTLQAQKLKLEGAGGRVGGATAKEGTAEIERANQAITKQNALKRLGAEIDAGNLEFLREAVRLQTEQEAIITRLHIEAGTASPFPRQQVEVGSARQPRTFEQTAGGLAAAEEAQAKLNAEVSYYNEELAAQAALWQKNVAAQRASLEVDQAHVAALAEQRALADALAASTQRAYAAGAAAATRGRPLSAAQESRVFEPPPGMLQWTKGQQDLLRYNTELGKYDTYATKASVDSERLSANFTRLGVAQAEASNQLRRHGALTTEFISALARGETTVNEFGYQVGATIGKFAGWTAAAAATYGALGAVAEFGKGAIDASSGVQQLTRTIDNLDRGKASQAIIDLSASTNVPIKEAADAMFRYSRTFHDVDTAAGVAKLGLAAFKLDQVDINTSVRTSTALYTQWGLTLDGQRSIYDQLSAGQREFNARMQETIPLLGKSAGAAKNAGGDLNQLVQLAVLAQRLLPTLGGTQIGTGIYRSAATFLSPTTTKGIKDREVVQSLGVNINQGFTEILRDAIKQSANLAPNDRARLSAAIFGPQFGGRLSGLFSPAGAQQLGLIEQRINPQATRGSLDTELSRELGTTRERLHSIVNEMQRVGASLADSGIISFLDLLLGGLTTVGHGVRDVVQVFDSLPAASKEVIAGLLALRTTMLFLNRTRFGASFGPLSRVARIPGIDPTFEAQQARAALATGTSTAISAVEADIQAVNAKLLASGAQQAELEAKRAAVQRQILVSSGDISSLQRESNAINENIERETARQVTLEAERNAQQAALAKLTQQRVALTATSRDARLSNAEVLALSAQVRGTGSEIAGGSAITADTAAQGRLASAKLRLATVLRINGSATERAAAASTADAEAANAAAAASTAAVTETEASAGIMSRIGGRLRGLTAALDPLLVAIVAVPLLIGELKKLSDAAKKATDATQPGQATSIQQLNDQIRNAVQKNSSGQTSLGPSLGGLNPFSEDENSANARYAAAQALKTLGQSIQSARQRTFASPIQQVGFSVKELTDETNADVQAFREHKITKQEFERRMKELERSSRSSLEVLTAGSTKQANNAIASLGAAIKSQLTAAIANSAKSAKDFFDALEGLDTKQLTQRVQSYADRANVYGLSGGDLKKAGETYLFLAAKYRASNDEKGLQLVQQAQQAFIGAVNKNVGDFLKAAQSATTLSGEQGDIGQAISTIQTMHTEVQRWVDIMDKKFRKYPAIVKAVGLAAKQIDSQLNDQLKSAIDQQIQLIEQNAQLVASRIQGASPESAIARAEATLSGLRQALAKAKAEGANWQTIAGLMTQINTSVNDIINQQIQNARSIVQAQGQLATSQIGGIGPGADISRAQQDVTNAVNLLSFDQSHHAGQAQLLQDQAAVNQAQQSLNQQIQQRDQQLHQDYAAFVQSEIDLQKSQTLDPIRQLREQLAGDVRLLGAIQPSDFKTGTEYQTAINQARAKINSDRNNLNDAIIQADLRNLQFEHNIHKITDQAYIDGLRQILRNKHLTIEERQQVLEQIYNLQHQSSQLDLNVGNIKLPSIYEIRRAIGLGKRGDIPAAQNTVINHTASVVVNVYGPRGAQAVGKVLDDHLGTTVKSAMRAKGLV